MLANVKNFVSFDDEGIKDAGVCLANKLLRVGISTRPVDNYKLNDWLRISVGTESDNLKLVTALKELKEKPF